MRRINWNRGFNLRKTFSDFVADKLAWCPMRELTLQVLIDSIQEEYRCSYERAYYKLMEWVKQNRDDYEYAWRGHNRVRVVRPRQ